jgi:hypothetical protein
VKRRIVLLMSAAALVLAGSGAVADEQIEIRLFGRYFMEPATVQVTVAVAPDRNNRMLHIEADGERMYRSSEVALVGDGEKRLHTIQFKNLAAGNYTLRAEVLSSSESIIAMAEQELVVAGR